MPIQSNPTGTGSLKESSAPCKFFLKGNCKFGASCKRRHDVSSTPAVERLTCAHPALNEGRLMDNSLSTSGQRHSANPAAWIVFGNFTNEEPPENASSSISAPPPEKHVHVSSPSITVNTTRPTRQKSTRQKSTRQQNQKPDNLVCFAWRAGTCRRGDFCKFKHDAEVQQQRVSSPVFVAREIGDTHDIQQSVGTGARGQRPDTRRTQRQRAHQRGSKGAQDVNHVMGIANQQGTRGNDGAQRAAQEAEQERQRKVTEERAAELARQEEMERQRKAAEAEQLRIEREAERAEREAQRRKAEEERAEHLRIQQEARRAERVRREEGFTIRQVELGSTIVTFSAGAAIDRIVTGFESCRVQVKNLPLDAKCSEVCEWFRAQGVEEEKFYLVNMNKVKQRQEASFIVDGEAEKTVALELNGTDFRGSSLEFTVSDSETIGGMYSTRDGAVLTVQWRAPSVRFVASYAYAERADEKMREVNGKVINGRRIRVERNRTRQGTLDPCSLLISGFTPQTSDQAVIEAFQAPDVRRLPNAIGYDEEAAKTHVKGLINGNSLGSNVRLEGPTLDYFGRNYTLRARFDTWDKAKVIHDRIHQKKYPYIGNATFRLWLPDPVQYQINVSPRQYKAQKKQWDAFVSDTAGRKGSYVLITQHNDYTPTLVRVGGDDSQAVGLLKVRVERLAAGDKLDLWHRSFGNAAGQRFLESIFPTVGAHVAQDWRMKIVKVYGEPSAIAKAREMIMKEIERLSGLEYTVPLKRQSIRFFAQRGIASLKETFGEDSVTLDIATSPCRITIRGGEEARHALSRLIDESLDELAVTNPAPNHENSTCPICLDEVSTPVQLGCGHEYCTACIRHFFTADIKTFPLVCMGNEATCLKPIALPIIQRFLTPQQFNALLETAFVSHIEKNPQSYKYCPTPDCVQIYRRTADDTAALQLSCPSCLITICSRCQEGHDGMTCEERRIQSDPAEQERLNEEWARTAGVKKCPSCNVWIEKTEGCNHMTCKCGAHVCWVCLGIFQAGTIYDHMGTAHGGIYADDNRPRVAQQFELNRPRVVQQLEFVNQRDDDFDYIEQARRLREFETLQAVRRRQEAVTQAQREAARIRNAEFMNQQDDDFDYLERARRRRELEAIQAARRREEAVTQAGEQLRRAGERIQAQQPWVAQRHLAVYREPLIVREPRARQDEGGWGCTVM